MRKPKVSPELRTLRKKLALPATLSEHERECYYVRCAVDNMRRATTHIKGVPGTETEQSYKLACFTSAIRFLFSIRDTKKQFNNARDVEKVIYKTARFILGGNELSRRSVKGILNQEVDRAIYHFTDELRLRLNEPWLYDPVETVTLIEYRLRYAKFFLMMQTAAYPKRWVRSLLCVARSSVARACVYRITSNEISCMWQPLNFLP